MSKNLTELIRKLSEVYDPNSKDTYVSLYLNRESNKKFINRRVQVCKSILKGDELNFFSGAQRRILMLCNCRSLLNKLEKKVDNVKRFDL